MWIWYLIIVIELVLALLIFNLHLSESKEHLGNILLALDEIHKEIKMQNDLHIVATQQKPTDDGVNVQ